LVLFGVWVILERERCPGGELVRLENFWLVCRCYLLLYLSDVTIVVYSARLGVQSIAICMSVCLSIGLFVCLYFVRY